LWQTGRRNTPASTAIRLALSVACVLLLLDDQGRDLSKGRGLFFVIGKNITRLMQSASCGEIVYDKND